MCRSPDTSWPISGGGGGAGRSGTMLYHCRGRSDSVSVYLTCRSMAASVDHRSLDHSKPDPIVIREQRERTRTSDPTILAAVADPLPQAGRGGPGGSAPRGNTAGTGEGGRRPASSIRHTLIAAVADPLPQADGVGVRRARPPGKYRRHRRRRSQTGDRHPPHPYRGGSRPTAPSRAWGSGGLGPPGKYRRHRRRRPQTGEQHPPHHHRGGSRPTAPSRGRGGPGGSAPRGNTAGTGEGGRRPASSIRRPGRTQGSRTTARALLSTFSPAEVAVSARTTRFPSCFSWTVPLTSMVAPWSSSGTTTGAVNLTPKSSTVAVSPAQSVTNRPAWAMVNMPCAMTFGRPTERAIRSFQWITLKSPDAPAYLTRLSLVAG